MRFRYFDDEGTEVELSSVDALDFRVQTGAVTPDTLLYDAAVGHWAPAAEHPIYRFLTEEGAAPPPDADGGDRTAGSGGAETDRDPPGRAPDADLPDLSFLTPSGAGADAGDGATPDTGGSRDGLPTGGEREEARDPAPAVERPDPGGGPSGGTAVAQESEGPALRSSSRGWGVQVDELEIPSSLVSRTSSHAPAEEDRRSGGTVSRAVAGLAAAAKRLALPALTAVAATGLVLGLRQVDPEAILERAELPRVESLRAAAFGGDARGVGEAGEPAPPDADAPESRSDGPEEPGRPEAPAAADIEEVESLVPEVIAAASGDLAAAMTELQRALGVAERPPDRWLDGIYLASAGRYPEVGEYWRGYGRWVAAVASMEERLFRGFVRERALGAGLDSAGAAAVSSRVLARYERTARQRELVYRDLAALAEEAAGLHETLARHQGSISYEPFTGGELSRDPVIEAVPDDPELARRIWNRLDRIFDILDRVQGVRPVSTLRLQEALLSGLALPDRRR